MLFPKDLRITATVLLTLMFGICASALVNEITDQYGVHWSRAIAQGELVVLLLLAAFITVLAVYAAREDSQQWSSIAQKLNAIQAQLLPKNTVVKTRLSSQESVSTSTETATQIPHVREVLFSSDAKIAIEKLNSHMNKKAFSLLNWLSIATISEIALNDDVKKIPSNNASDFIVRLGNMRLLIDLNLREGIVFVKGFVQK